MKRNGFSSFVEMMVVLLVLFFLVFFFLLPVLNTMIPVLPRLPNFFKKKFYTIVLMRTLRIGLSVTSLAIIISYPVSIFITSLEKFKAFFISLVLFPLMTNTVVRTFGWIVILGKDGMVNRILSFFGFEPVRILYTDVAVIVGLLHLFSPLMILSLVGAMENIDREYKEVARNLGATPIKVFFDVILPMSLKGLVTGSLLVFVGSITSYVTPKLLGGPRFSTLSMVLYQKAMVVMDWDGAELIALIMTVVTTVFLVFLGRTSRILRVVEK